MDDLGNRGQWEELLQYINDHGRNLVNGCKLPLNETETASLFTSLHYAALLDAPVNVIEDLVEFGALKSLKTADGRTAYDIGVEKGISADKLEWLSIPAEIKEKEDEIQRMEQGLHSVINGRVEQLIRKNGQALPQLSVLFERGSFYYPVPGMYGGFNVNKHPEGIQADSWIRVCGGSEENHLIYRDGTYKLLPNDNPM